MQVIRASSQGQLLEGPAIPLHFGHFQVKGGGRQGETSLLGVAGRPGSFPRQGPVTRSQSQRKGTAQVSHLDHQLRSQGGLEVRKEETWPGSLSPL